MSADRLSHREKSQRQRERDFRIQFLIRRIDRAISQGIFTSISAACEAYGIAEHTYFAEHPKK